jgi:hypothetical protein
MPPDGADLRVLVPVAARRSGEPQLLQLTQSVPSLLRRHAESVQTVHRDYQELSLARAA